MKNAFLHARRDLLALTATFSLIFLLIACDKNREVVQSPAAALMAFNLAPDQNAIGVALDGNNFTTSPLYYTTFSGAYNSIYTGNRQVTTYPYGSASSLVTSNFLFEDSMYYSLFFLGNNGHYENLIVKDNLDSLPSGTGNAFVRYINAIPDSVRQPMVNITSDGSNVFNNMTPYKTVSGFKGVAPGDLAINVSSNTAINASRNISVEDGKVYTILVIGMPAAADTAQQVMIKYIQNGIIQ